MFGFGQKKIFTKRVDAYSNNPKTGEVDGWACVNLYENKKTGKREFEVFGRWTDSPAALKVKSGVHAWVFGGPIPDGMVRDQDETPPKPRKDIPPRKTKTKPPKVSGNVLSFPKEKAA